MFSQQWKLAESTLLRIFGRKPIQDCRESPAQVVLTAIDRCGPAAFKFAHPDLQADADVSRARVEPDAVCLYVAHFCGP